MIIIEITRSQKQVDVFYNSKTKIYRDGKKQTTICSSAIYKSKYDIKKDDKKEFKLKNKKIKEVTKPENFIVRDDSVKRAKDKVFDIVYQNDWDYFLTITIDKKCLDRYDVNSFKKVLKTWLQNNVKRKGLRYILIPEHHKDGALHAHALINKDVFNLVDSGHKTKDCKIIYNVENWLYGFSTAIPVNGDSQSLAFYITKYLTKESCKIFGKFYWSSRNIKRTVDVEYNNIDYDSFDSVEYGSFKYDSDFKFKLKGDL